MGLRALFFLSLLASCAGSPARPAELRASVPFHYRASLASRGFERDEPRAPGTSASERRIRVEVSVLQCSEETAAEWLGELAAGPQAWIGSAAEAAALLEGGDGRGVELVAARLLELCDGAEARVAVIDQRAYVGRFELEGDGRTMIADPVVETLEHGMRLDVGARIVADGAIEVALGWRICALDRELPELEHELPLGGVPVTVQVPLALSQELTTRAELGRDDGLVLTCPDGRGRQQVVLVRAAAL